MEEDCKTLNAIVATLARFDDGITVRGVLFKRTDEQRKMHAKYLAGNLLVMLPNLLKLKSSYPPTIHHESHHDTAIMMVVALILTKRISVLMDATDEMRILVSELCKAVRELQL
jgi:hypothetical protein